MVGGWVKSRGSMERQAGGSEGLSGWTVRVDGQAEFWAVDVGALVAVFGGLGSGMS